MFCCEFCGQDLRVRKKSLQTNDYSRMLGGRLIRQCGCYAAKSTRGYSTKLGGSKGLIGTSIVAPIVDLTRASPAPGGTPS
jgi:hypothetical protein